MEIHIKGFTLLFFYILQDSISSHEVRIALNRPSVLMFNLPSVLRIQEH